MSAHAPYQQDKRQIEQETDAEVAFGILLEQADVDCDAFMQQWHISHNQFNRLSHYLYGLTEELPELPPELAVLLLAGRQQRTKAAQATPQKLNIRVSGICSQWLQICVGMVSWNWHGGNN